MSEKKSFFHIELINAIICNGLRFEGDHLKNYHFNQIKNNHLPQSTFPAILNVLPMYLSKKNRAEQMMKQQQHY